MKRILIYDSTISGHHMEYLHHIYMAIEGVDAEFVFVIPEEFNHVKDKLSWPDRKNVKFDFIPKDTIEQLRGGWFASRWRRARTCAQYVKKHNAEEIFFIELVIQFPFLPLFLPKGVKVSGIVYQLVPYEWNRLSLISKIKCGLEVWSYTKTRCAKAPMMLNDPSCASYLNKHLRKNNIISIVDPVMPLNYSPKIVREEFGMNESDKMILHFGAMNKRKGTLLILEAVAKMTEDQLKDKVFVFAGKINNEIKERFYALKEDLSKNARIFVFDEFVSYEHLADLCHSCDCIVVPYTNYSYSSGVIGYSAQFFKSVIGPSQGILGKLIRRNHLGLTFDDMSADALAKVLTSGECFECRPNEYAEKENVKAFTNTIIDTLLR